MHYNDGKFHEAALIIQKMKFYDKFDVKTLLVKLVDQNKIPTAKLLIAGNKDLALHLIGLLSTNVNIKVASEIIKEFKFDINEFPDVKERLMKNSMRYYLGRFLYKKPEHEEFLSLDRIEDMFLGFKPMLGYLVEDLLFKGKKNEAKGLCIRHNLFDVLRKGSQEELNDVVYDPTKEAPHFDHFAPLSKPLENYIILP